MSLPRCCTLSLMGLLAAGSLHGAELVAIADTWVHGAPNLRSVNYGGGEFMKVRSRGPRAALIQFDTGSLSAGAESGAMLSLHVSRVVVPGVVQIHPVVSAWSEDDVTFDTRPMLGPEVVGTLNIAAADSGQRLSVDVSPLVASWITDPDSNFGLAITADGSPADVYFGTRDVAMAPELVVAVMNSVTVSQNGGDYGDPVTAANQAFAGDTWCVNPTRDAPCTINIDEGIYVLAETLVIPENVVVIGAGKTTTLLVAASGLDVAVEAGMAMDDLAIINRQDSSITRAVGLRSRGAALTRVVVRSEGAIDNVGMELEDPDFVIVLVETDITAAGGQNAFAIDMNTGPGEINVHTSRITAIGAAVSNEGITKGLDRGGSVFLTDTAVVATGGRLATGITISDEEGGSVTMAGGTVTAFATERAVGIAGGEFSEDLTIEGARIVVDGPGEAVGISWGGVTNVVVTVTDVLVDSSDVAISTFLEESGDLTIATSQLVGRRRALDVEHDQRAGVSVSIETSVLRGEEWIGTAGGEDIIDVSNSILDGEANLQGPVTVSCTGALGGDYQPLGANCLPQ